jgi:hypothetical protein
LSRDLPPSYRLHQHRIGVRCTCRQCIWRISQSAGRCRKSGQRPALVEALRRHAQARLAKSCAPASSPEDCRSSHGLSTRARREPAPRHRTPRIGPAQPYSPSPPSPSQYASHSHPRAGLSRGSIVTYSVSSASSPYDPCSTTWPSGPTTRELPIHFLPFHGPPLIQPTLLTPTIHSENCLATGD